MNTLNPGPRRVCEANLITGVLAVPLALGVAGSVVPGLDDAVTAVLIGLIAVAVLVGLARIVARRLRERREDRADAVTAAAWRADNALLLTGRGVA